jgi:UPF0755 protein
MKFRVYLGLTVLLITAILGINRPNVAKAASTPSKYGIIIADEKGSYTFYNMNDSSNKKAAIQITKSGSIMVPLEKVIKLIPGLSYQYDSAKKKLTVKNSNNGKRIIYTLNSKTMQYYSSSKAKAVKKTLSYQMYRSKISSASMVPMDSLKWVLKSVKGYQFYSASKLQGLGYDTVTYSGVIVYHYNKIVESAPKATTVKGIPNTLKVSIPEGYSVAQTFDLLVKKGVAESTAALFATMANYDYSYYPLVEKIQPSKNRCFKLEGYLYPDTYEFYRLSKPQDIIGKFLRNAETKLTKADREAAEALGYSVDEILTIASLIEKETGDHSLMPKISSVIHNRLNVGMKLQFDSSIFYVERYIKPYISGDINRYNSYYNTYKCAALPAGSICNPGRAAIQAALNPEATDYLFFYSDKNGEYHFSAEYVDPKSIQE